MASGLVAGALILFAFPPSRNQLYPQFSSFRILDRNGQVLREVLSRDYKTSVWVDIERISPHLITATIMAEDKRFFFHHGVDPFALLRAIYDNARNGKIVSGGSTITMQVAKLALGLKKRNLFSKIAEMVYALKLELYLSKEKILEVYLNRAPYGNQTYGVGAAAHLYFDKPAIQLSLASVVFLPSFPGYRKS